MRTMMEFTVSEAPHGVSLRVDIQLGKIGLQVRLRPLKQRDCSYWGSTLPCNLDQAVQVVTKFARSLDCVAAHAILESTTQPLSMF